MITIIAVTSNIHVILKPTSWKIPKSKMRKIFFEDPWLYMQKTDGLVKNKKNYEIETKTMCAYK